MITSVYRRDIVPFVVLVLVSKCRICCYSMLFLQLKSPIILAAISSVFALLLMFVLLGSQKVAKTVTHGFRGILPRKVALQVIEVRPCYDDLISS